LWTKWFDLWQTRKKKWLNAIQKTQCHCNRVQSSEFQTGETQVFESSGEMFGSMRSLKYHYAPFQTQVPSHGHWCDLKVDHHNSALQSGKENVTIERTSPSVLAENWTS
jgi:hypothetical protein